MSLNRFMRVIVMFDLPMQTSTQIREYSAFRKFLLKEGFLMMQQSIYTKIILNQTIMSLLVARVKHNLPKNGLVQMLKVTEKQFSQMEVLCGEGNKNSAISTLNRLVII